MIFVVIGWGFMFLTIITVVTWLHDSKRFSNWNRVKIMSYTMLSVSFFFFFLHFSNPSQESEMQDSLFLKKNYTKYRNITNMYLQIHYNIYNRSLKDVMKSTIGI